MGLLSFFKSGRESPSADAADPIPWVIDLGTFQVGATRLGAAPAGTEPYAAALQAEEAFEDSAGGVELGAKEGVLDSVFLTIERFGGQLLRGGAPLPIGRETTEAVVCESFGEPYWIDRSDGETILFYEYAAGSIELQFEFPSAKGLGFVTLSRQGVLSDEADRKAYGVDKPWPPA